MTTLPYSLSSIRFQFPALAALAARLPLGGGREVVLATLMISRLAAGMLPPDLLAVEDRQSRAASAKIWLASIALPSVVRTTLLRALEASTDSSESMVSSMKAVTAVAAPYLDMACTVELERFVRKLSDLSR